MRPHALALITCGFSACTQQVADDPLDAPIALTAVDTVAVEWRSIGLVGLAPPEHFVWTCGTFDRTPLEWAALDSSIAAFRKANGVTYW